MLYKNDVSIFITISNKKSDVETGLYYNVTRYYNPEWGRFLSADDVSYLDPSSINGLNLYAYCKNNPIMFSDLNGTFAISLTILGLIIGATIVATAGGVIAYNVAKNNGAEGGNYLAGRWLE